jgi:hypothetical protein
MNWRLSNIYGRREAESKVGHSFLFIFALFAGFIAGFRTAGFCLL